MDHISDLKAGPLDSSLEQQAASIIDGAIDQAVNLVIHRLPASSEGAEQIKRRIKEAAYRELAQLVASGRRI